VPSKPLGCGSSAVTKSVATETQKQRPKAPQTAWLSDGEGQNRTADTTIFSRVLYQLSYLAGGG
jgi:hypothetical protein